MKQMLYTEFARVRDAQNLRLIDVREADEYAQVHVRDAEHVALSCLRRGVFPEVDARDIALICKSGVRSAMAAQLLEDAGVAEVINISDGTLGAVATGAAQDLVRG